MKVLNLTLLIILTISTTSCATIFSGTTQSVSFQSEPSQANVSTIDKKGIETVIGTTPCTAVISKKTKKIKFEKENFYIETYPISSEAKINGWYYLDLIGCLTLVGIPSAIVDLSTGSIINLPKTINVELKKK